MQTENLFRALCPVYTLRKRFRMSNILLSLMYTRNLLLYAENFLRSKFCLKKQKYARRTKLFTPRKNRAFG